MQKLVPIDFGGLPDQITQMELTVEACFAVFSPPSAYCSTKEREPPDGDSPNCFR